MGIMRHQIIADETLQNRREAIAYLERVLHEALQADAATGNAAAERVHLCCIDTGAEEISDRRAEYGGSPREMSEKAIACFEEADDHHVGVVMTAGDRRISLKAAPEGYRVTISPLERQGAAADSLETIPDAAHAIKTVPTSPRPPGLSSGVPDGVLPEAADSSGARLRTPDRGDNTEPR